MKRERNTKFFDNANNANKQTSMSIKHVLRNARSSGNANVSNRSLSAFPNEICFYEENIDSDEKYWETYPLTKLDLSYNKIPSISPDISRLSELSILKIRDNILNEVHENIFACTLLRHLDLGINKITSIPENIGNLQELRELFLCDNQLTSLPVSLTTCRALQLLEVQSNRLSAIPRDFHFPSLTKLNLSHNSLREVPGPIAHMVSLVSLEVHRNSLSVFPDLGRLSRLVYLDVSENQLSQIPQLPGNPCLDRLNISFNRISQWDMPSLCRQSESLTEVHCHDNIFTEIPSELANLRKLKVLDVSNNNINDIPATLGYLAPLQRFVIEGNPIRSIRRSLLTQSTNDLKAYLRTRGQPLSNGNDPSNATTVVDDYNVHTGFGKGAEIVERTRNMVGQTLDLSSMQLKDWTNEMDEALKSSHVYDRSTRNIKSVNSLLLNRNEFVLFPFDFICQFSNLKSLNFCENRLGMGSTETNESYLSSDTRDSLRSLTQLDLSSNKLSSNLAEVLLSTAVNFRPVFTALTELHLSHNSLHPCLPTAINALLNLRVLCANQNKIKSIDNIDFSKFSQLEVVDLSNNQLSEISPLLGISSGRISSLLLDNNNISNIPAALCSMEASLVKLGLIGNPIKSLRPDILSNTSRIMQTLRMRIGKESASNTSNSNLNNNGGGFGGNNNSSTNNCDTFDCDTSMIASGVGGAQTYGNGTSNMNNTRVNSMNNNSNSNNNGGTRGGVTSNGPSTTVISSQSRGRLPNNSNFTMESSNNNVNMASNSSNMNMTSSGATAHVQDGPRSLKNFVDRQAIQYGNSGGASNSLMNTNNQDMSVFQVPTSRASNYNNSTSNLISNNNSNNYNNSSKNMAINYSNAPSQGQSASLSLAQMRSEVAALERELEETLSLTSTRRAALNRTLATKRAALYNATNNNN